MEKQSPAKNSKIECYSSQTAVTLKVKWQRCKLSFSVSVGLVLFRQTVRSHDSLSTIFSNKRRLPVENEKSVINRTILMWKGRTW